MPSVKLNPEFFFKIRSNVPIGQALSTDLPTSGGFTVFNPSLNDAAFDLLKAKLKPTLLRAEPDCASHLVGAFSNFTRWGQLVKNRRPIEHIDLLLAGLKQKVHPALAYLPHHFEESVER